MGAENLSLGRVITKGWWIIVAGALIGAIVGAIGFSVWPSNYQATAMYAVGDAGSTDEINMETEKAIATSTEVLGRAAAFLPEWSISELQDVVSVAVPKDSELLKFTASTSKADDAAAIANAVAGAYGDNRGRTYRQQQEADLEQLQARISALRAQVDRVPAGSSRAEALGTELGSLEAESASLGAVRIDAGRVISPAVEPSSKNSLGIPVWLLGGAMAGFLAGFYLATILVRLRDRRASANASRAAEQTK